MNVKQVSRRIGSLSAGAGRVLTVVLLALVMALTVAAETPATIQPPGNCDGACGPSVIKRDTPARPFLEPVALVYLPMLLGTGDDRIWDARLDDLGVYLEPATTAPGEPYWQLVGARWGDPEEAGGDHTIYVDVLDSSGERALGQEVRVGWSGGSSALVIEKPPYELWGANFPMYGTLGSYDVRVPDLPSDRVRGLGLGTAQEPDVKHHTNFYLIYQQVVR